MNAEIPFAESQRPVPDATAAVHPSDSPVVQSHSEYSRPRVNGKFLFVGDQKLLVRGVTYGPFAPRHAGDDGHDPQTVERDFAEMSGLGINAVRVYTVPERWMLDTAQANGLRLLIGIPWEQHVAFLDDRARRISIEDRVRTGVRACKSHPAVLGYAIGNEIPARIVRWHGADKIERFLDRLCWAARDEDPGALVTYVNYPSTEYLRVPAVDFTSFNVYLDQPDRYDAYVARLQNLAGPLPLVMTEVGLDAQRHSQETQAAVVSAQLRLSFQRGVAGCFVFAWTDEWWRGGAEITDWGFGLTDRERVPKRALAAVKECYADAPFPRDTVWPSITVVVCSFNGERTITQCLDSLARLDYPSYEVVVVDDGSTDRTADIAARYDVRLIRTANQGLSAARNEGLRAANGEIVAYIDDDAYPDPDWLSHLAWTFMTSTHAGVGGPNLPPTDSGPTAELVSLAPGGPTHVLRSDAEAEHIPGCNSAFKADALRRVGGFDSGFRIAGDDVDLCWRMQHEGLTLGFSPGATVWHRPRGSIRAYLRQQRGYGRAEGLLERKWPSRYNALGHVSWPGQLYGHGVHDLPWRRGRQFEGTWGTEDYQSLYQPAGALGWLPLMPEWFLLLAAVTLIGLLGAAWPPLLTALPIAGAGVALSASFALGYAFKASRRGSFGRQRRLRRVGLLALLFLFQPIARLVGRVERGLTPWRHRGPRVFAMPRLHETSVWSEEWHSLPSRLQEIEESLQRTGAAVKRGGPFDRWDLEVRTGPLAVARLRGTSEEHDAGRQMVRYRLWPRLSWVGPLLAGGFMTLAVAAAGSQAIVPAAVFAVTSILIVARQIFDAATASAIGLRAVEPSSAVIPARVLSSARPRVRRQVPGGEGIKLFLRTLPYLIPFRRLAVLSVVILIVDALVDLAAPWTLKIIIDHVIGALPPPPLLHEFLGGIADDPIRLLLVMVVGGVLIAVANNGLTVWNTYIQARIEQGMILRFRSDMFAHAQRLSLAFHDRQRAGAFMYRINYSSAAIGEVPMMFLQLSQSLITLIGMFLIVYTLDPALAFLTVSITPGLWLLVRYYARHVEPTMEAVREKEGHSLTMIQEAMSMLRVIIGFGRERYEHKRFTEQGQEAVNARVRLTVSQMMFKFAVNVLTATGNAFVLGYGIFKVLQAELTLGQLLVTLAYVASVYTPLETIVGATTPIKNHIVNLKSAFGLLDTEPEVEEASNAQDVDRVSGQVEFSNVSFAYHGRSETLNNISFKVEPGQLVAVVGPTGAGKTTLMSLLPRFYDPKSGSILLDGCDIRSLTLDSLRQQFSLVLQEPLLFSASIAENIRYGRLDASQEEIEGAARAANAHDFIARLPNGYETILGERGAMLSGGERQRIAVARAFLKDAPILILDEPTSSIDSRTESVILDAIDRLAVGRTTFMIAHRLSTVRHSDLIVVLDRGRVVEQGTHAELLGHGGIYRQMHDVQARGARRRRNGRADGNGAGVVNSRHQTLTAG